MSVSTEHTKDEAVSDVPGRALQSQSTEMLVLMAVVVIIVMTILARLVQLAPVTMSIRIGVVMVLRQMLRT